MATSTPTSGSVTEPASQPPPQRPPRNPARPSTASSASHDRSQAWGVPHAAHTSSLLLTIDSSLRRNKSTGSKLGRIRPSNSLSTPSTGAQHLHPTGSSVSAQSSALQSTHPASRPSTTTRQLPSLDTQKPKLLKVHSVPPSPRQSKSGPFTQKQKHPQFSTADRTILEELKRNISARDAQFTRKSITRAKHHPHSRQEVPYPRSYARDVVDLDVWETAVCQQFCGNLTFHDIDSPPTKAQVHGYLIALDHGGIAILLESLRDIPDNFPVLPDPHAYVTGLDIVPLHPDLQRVGSSDLASRITWVQANFLDGLPFPNEEFDFVYIKRIARGIPEDKWSFFLEEITRVMKPGTALEMIEEDLFFPIAYRHPDPDDDPEQDPDRRSTTDSSDSHPSTFVVPGHRPEANIVPPQSDENELGKWHGPENHVPRDKVIQPPQSNLAPHMRRSHETRPQLVRAKSASAAVTPFPTSLSSIRPSTSHVTQGSSLPPQMVNTKSVSVSAVSLPISGAPAPQLLRTPGSPAGSTSLLRTLPCVPPNPSDHTLLERIYTEMHSARFINLAPLSLLANSLSVYFKDVRTHPPLLVMFPPRVFERKNGDSRPASPAVDNGWDSDSDSDGARNAIRPLGSRARTTPRPNRGQPKENVPTPRQTLRPHDGRQSLYSVHDGPQWLSEKNFLDRTTLHLSQNDSRTLAYSPSTRASFPSSVYSTFPTPVWDSNTSLSQSVIQNDEFDGMEIHEDRGSIRSSTESKVAKSLPNAVASFDSRTFNLHLALRTTEILACAEAMWEWVLDSQQKRREQGKVPLRSRAGSINGIGPRVPGSISFGGVFATPEDEVAEAIAELTRDDFDGLLSKFDQDMRQYISIGKVLQEEYGWTNVRLPPSSGDKAYDEARDEWEEWEQWERRHQRRQETAHPSHQHMPRHSQDAYTHDDYFRSSATSTERGAFLNFDSRRSSTITAAKRTVRREVHPSGSRLGMSVEGSSSMQQQQQQQSQQQPLCRSLRVFGAWKA